MSNLKPEVETALDKCHPSRWLHGSATEARAAHDFLRTALERSAHIEAAAKARNEAPRRCPSCGEMMVPCSVQDVADDACKSLVARLTTVEAALELALQQRDSADVERFSLKVVVATQEARIEAALALAKSCGCSTCEMFAAILRGDNDE
jgi:hypothetical protein